MDKKAEAMLLHYKELIDNNLFDEYDLLGFLILIRPYLKAKYKYIKDVADLIAHRERDRGLVIYAIKGGKKNNYSIKKKSGEVTGYHGIKDNSKWEKEWCSLFSEYHISYTKQTLLDVTLCICSLIQETKYITKDKKNKKCKNGKKDTVKVDGIITLLIERDGFINIATTDTLIKSPTITFAKFGTYNLDDFFKKFNFHGFANEAVPIFETVETYRNGDKLHLKTISGSVII